MFNQEIEDDNIKQDSVIDQLNAEDLSKSDAGWSTTQKVLLSILLTILGLAVLAIAAFFIVKGQKKKNDTIKALQEQSQEAEDMKELKNFNCTVNDAELKENVTLGTVARDATDAHGSKTFSNFTETEGLKVSEEVKKAIKTETQPNLAVSGITGTDGKTNLIENATGLKVHDGKIITVDKDGKINYFDLKEGMKVTLDDGTVLEYNDLKVMDNVAVDSDGKAVLYSESTKGNFSFTRDNVSGDFHDSQGTNYFSFKTDNLTYPYYDITKNCMDNKASVLDEQKNKVAKNFINTWLTQKDHNSTKVSWDKQVDDKTVTMKDLKNEKSKDNLKEAAKSTSASL